MWITYLITTKVKSKSFDQRKQGYSAAAKRLPSLLVFPIVPNVTRKHKKFFDSSSYSLPLGAAQKLDMLAAYAISVSHTPGLMLKAYGVGSSLIARFSGPSALEHFNLPFMSEANEAHITKGVDLRRSTFPWLFLSNEVPSFQTQPMAFTTHRLLTSEECSEFRGGSRGFASKPIYEVKAFFLNLDLPTLAGLSLPPRSGPVQNLIEMVEKEFYSFSTMLSAKHPGSDFPLVKVSRLFKDASARASVDEVETGSELKIWNLFFKKEEELLQLVLMIKARIFKNTGLMTSSEPVAAKIKRKWI